MIYQLQRDFNKSEHWCCALTKDRTMLFAINHNREYFVLNKNDEKSKEILAKFIYARNIFLSWDKKVNYWCRECFNLMPINMLLNVSVKRISYELACYRTGVSQVHVKDNEKNDCALEAQNILHIYENFLYEKVYMILSLSKEYKIDFTNTNVTSVIEKIPSLKTAYNKPTTKFFYQAPQHVQFDRPDLKKLYDDVINNEFVVVNGKITHPCLPRTLQFGDTVVTVGVGGLHGFCDRINGTTTKDAELNDWDFDCFYPSLICRERSLRCLFGDEFVTEYNKMRENRIKLKQTNPNLARGYKEVLNSATGKLNYQLSKLYNPQAYVQVTLTGQFWLLMIADTCVRHGIPVLSINTDGITVLDNVDATERSENIIKRIEILTGLSFTKTGYCKYFGKNVNNYIAFKKDNSVKAVGDYRMKRDVDKNYNNLAVNKLVAKVLVNGGRPEHYLKDLEIQDFLNIACSKSANEQIRFYKAKNRGSIALRFSNGNSVPLSAGCAIMNDFEPVKTIVEKIDYDYYLDKAQQMLDSIEPSIKRLFSDFW